MTATGESAPRDDAASGMRDLADLGEITPDILRKTFPSWRIFCHLGVWWAIRGGHEALYGPQSLRRCVLTAPQLIALAEKLCLQEWLDSLSPDELAAVYGDTTDPEATR